MTVKAALPATGVTLRIAVGARSVAVGFVVGIGLGATWEGRGVADGAV